MASARVPGQVGPPDQLSSGVGMREHIVPIVRQWLKGGVSAENLRSSVRIQEISELAGGLKAPAVGAVSVSVQVIIKQGSNELLWHKLMMNEVNRRAAARKSRNLPAAIFPEVMLVERINEFSADRDHLMIQQALVKFETVQSLLYEGTDSFNRAERALHLALPAIRFIHSIVESPRGRLSGLPRNPDPFTKRITERLQQLAAQIPWLETAFSNGVAIDDEELPPLSQVVKFLATWQAKRTNTLKLRLVHGDPHIANLMTRQRGRSESIRWIDPNPTIGFSDPAYDWGKILHFLEPVGWAKQSPDFIQSRVLSSKKTPRITTALPTVSPEIETARQRLEAFVREAALTALRSDPHKEAVLELAVASAHAGYAALPIDPAWSTSVKSVAEKRRQYALALKLRALSRWHRIAVGGD